MKLSAVILAKTDSAEIFKMTMECISSLKSSEQQMNVEIILVESNKQYYSSGFQYPNDVKIIIPEAEFNFHKFLNIGIKESAGEYIALCNNDLIFKPNWFTAMMAVASKHPEIQSFSPATIPSAQSDGFSSGYKVMTHIKGWCIVVHKRVFSKVGMLDEAFDFYYADNDYAMTLKSMNIKHAMVHNSHVIHLEKEVALHPVTTPDTSFIDKYDIPKYILQPKYEWLFKNEKNLSGFLKFHNKWGTPDFLYKKNKMADMLQKNGFGFLVPLFFKIKL